jgi:hypothetical protein
VPGAGELSIRIAFLSSAPHEDKPRRTSLRRSESPLSP